MHMKKITHRQRATAAGFIGVGVTLAVVAALVAVTVIDALERAGTSTAAATYAGAGSALAVLVVLGLPVAVWVGNRS